MPIETRAVRSAQELATAIHVHLRAFGSDAAADKVARRAAYAQAYPGYAPDHVRVRLVDQEMVSSLRLVDRVLRVGIAEWRLAGVADVSTAPEARQQGHARALLEDALAWMRQQRFDVSALHGIPNFYDRLGYAVIWPDTYFVAPLDQALALTSDHAIRDATPADIPALSALYEAAWEMRPGSLARDEAYWRWLLDHRTPLWAALTPSGEVAGYAGSHEWEPGYIFEMVAANASAARALARRAATYAREVGASQLRVISPRDDPVVGWLRRACTLTVSEHTEPAGGWMARFIDLPAAMAKLTEELNARLLRSTLGEWRGRINLETDLGVVALACRYGRVSIIPDPPAGGVTCRIPQDRLLQLVLGYRTCAEVVSDPDVSIPEAAQAVLQSLFPPQAPYMAGLDWF